jgi:hypothetical protein
MDELQKLYRMPEGGRIQLYLAARPELVDILLEARSHIELQFGRSVGPTMRLIKPQGSTTDRRTPWRRGAARMGLSGKR